MNTSSPSMLKPALIGGLSFGVVGGLPFLGAINCACCALVIGAGFLAAFLYSKECKKVGAEFRGGKGALQGLIAAPLYALGHAGVGLFFTPSAEEFDEILEQMASGGAPPEVVDTVGNVLNSFTGPGAPLIAFFFVLLVAAVFSTVGGLIGGAVFKVEPPAPPPAEASSAPTSPPAPPAPPRPPVDGGDGGSEGT